MTRIATRALVALLVAAWWLLVPAARGDARAEDPVRLSGQGQITDPVDALGDLDDQVETALDRLYDTHRVQLFVAYVHDFSGRSAQTWADETATKNGLGQDDILLAVATRDRRYAYSADTDAPLSQRQLDEVARTAIEPALRQNDWAGAAIGAANGYAAVLSGQPVPVPSITPGAADPGGGEPQGASGADLIVPIAVAGGAGALAVYAYTRRRRRAAKRTTPGAAVREQGWGHPEGTGTGAPAPLPELPELDVQAKRTLVETDDAIRTSREELGFATAQFGEEATRPFTEALEYAQGELTAAFRLRQALDDAYPEDDATRRLMLNEIISRCAEANRRLDDQTDDFDRLRALEENAPQALAAADAAYRELTGRADTAQATLTVMGRRYAESAAAPVAGDVEQARHRLLFASTTLGEARRALDGGDNAAAAVQIRAAEGAVDQATRLIDAVDRRAQDLAEAAGKLPGALSETDADLADARGLLEGTAAGISTADLQGRIGRAETVVAEVRKAVGGGPYDPIDALRRVEEADAMLDEALAGARESEHAGRRARALLDQATLTARSTVTAATDFVTTHRGAVGAQARTRLTEAHRRLERAVELSDVDPQGALTEAQQADALARQAQGLAEQDVRSYGDPFGPGGGGGRLGGGGGGGGLNGAVLGGIILGGLFGGGGHRGGGGFGGGFGGTGGGFGGGQGGGFGGRPGSFGGGGTRGRMGGGGRF
ncbi:TPM domain-containing protein [Streptomyces sp. NPDC127084]|uniref:TPM domain-containing protein n=1 Tax=Streptomyces sp. NPDC127084 TaxID=3347133 RepID=UPI00365D8022